MALPVLFLSTYLRDDALLVHGLKLPLLRLRLLLQRLHRLLEPLRHLLLEVLGRPGVLLPHTLVLLLEVGPILHDLRTEDEIRTRSERFSLGF